MTSVYKPEMVDAVVKVLMGNHKISLFHHTLSPDGDTLRIAYDRGGVDCLITIELPRIRYDIDALVRHVNAQIRLSLLKSNAVVRRSYLEQFAVELDQALEQNFFTPAVVYMCEYYDRLHSIDTAAKEVA